MNQSFLSSAEHRARVILDAYGSQPEAWPVNERQAILDCLARSAILQRYRAQLEELDDRIASAQSDALRHGDTRALQQRILSQLPGQFRPAGSDKPALRKSSAFGWLHSPRLAVALASVLLLVVILGTHHIPPTPRPQATASASFAAWTWYDITGQDLQQKQSSSSASMTDLIDMDLNQAGG